MASNTLPPKWSHLPADDQIVMVERHVPWDYPAPGDVCSHPRCTEPAVAVLWFNGVRRRQCTEHLAERSRWIQGGQVVKWDVP